MSVEEANSQSESSIDLVDLNKVRERYDEFVGAGNLDHALMLLEQISRWPDSTRYIDDNLWLYGKLGDMNRALDHEDEAMDAYARGFELDPRELAILQPYSELLFHHERSEKGLEVVQALLLHHKRALPSEEVGAIYRRLGAFYEGVEKWGKARAAYEKSLDMVPGHAQALNGLLRVVAQIGEPIDVVRVRQKLIRTMEDPIARSDALVALGDDWAYALNDPGRGLDTYEQAVVEHKENKVALQRLADVGSEIGDFRRVSRAYFTLSQLADDSAEKADYIIKSSLVARDELWEPDKALAGFKLALQLDPSRLDAFKAVTSLLVDAKDWEELEAAYVQLITANVEAGNEDPNLMAVLWKNLGENYKNNLKRESDAIFAFGQASDRVPNSIEFHEAVADLAEDNQHHLDEALKHLRAIFELDSSRVDALDRMGRVFLRQKEPDSAWCMFRAAGYLGHPLDEKAKAFLDRFDTALFRSVNRPMTPDIYNRFIFPRTMDVALSEVFRYLKVGLQEWAGESHSKHGLKRKDRVKLDEPLAFNRIYKSIGNTLGYQNLPELWRKPEQQGLVNGALVPEGMIAGDDILGSGREEYTAYIVGKQLFLFLAPFYLAAVRRASDLQVFMILGAAYVQNNLNFEKSKEMESALKAIKKKVKGKDLDGLKRAVDKISGRETDIPGWIECVEDTANRVGLIFCDDLGAAREYMEEDPDPISQRTIDERMLELVKWSVSEQYLQLREELGIKLG